MGRSRFLSTVWSALEIRVVINTEWFHQCASSFLYSFCVYFALYCFERWIASSLLIVEACELISRPIDNGFRSFPLLRTAFCRVSHWGLRGQWSSPSLNCIPLRGTYKSRFSLCTQCQTGVSSRHPIPVFFIIDLTSYNGGPLFCWGSFSNQWKKTIPFLGLLRVDSFTA